MQIEINGKDLSERIAESVERAIGQGITSYTATSEMSKAIAAALAECGLVESVMLAVRARMVEATQAAAAAAAAQLTEHLVAQAVRLVEAALARALVDVKNAGGYISDADRRAAINAEIERMHATAPTAHEGE